MVHSHEPCNILRCQEDLLLYVNILGMVLGDGPQIDDHDYVRKANPYIKANLQQCINTSYKTGEETGFLGVSARGYKIIWLG